MPILKKKLFKNFTTVSNDMLRNNELSWAAKGLLCYALSCKEDWVFTISSFMTVGPAGKDALRTILHELQEKGYLTITKLYPNQTSSGKIEYIYTFSDFNNIEDEIKEIKDRNIHTLNKQIKVCNSNTLHPYTYNNTNIINTNNINNSKELFIPESKDSCVNPTQNNTTPDIPLEKKVSDSVVEYEEDLFKNINTNNTPATPAHDLAAQNKLYKKYNNLLKSVITADINPNIHPVLDKWIRILVKRNIRLQFNIFTEQALEFIKLLTNESPNFITAYKALELLNELGSGWRNILKAYKYVLENKNQKRDNIITQEVIDDPAEQAFLDRNQRELVIINKYWKPGCGKTWKQVLAEHKDEL